MHCQNIGAEHGADIAPLCLKRAGAMGNAIGQIADEQGIEVGVVVFLDDVKIRGDDEFRSVPAGGYQHHAIGAEIIGGKTLAGDAGDAELCPVGHRPFKIGSFLRAGDLVRYAHFKAPVAAALPAAFC